MHSFLEWWEPDCVMVRSLLASGLWLLFPFLTLVTGHQASGSVLSAAKDISSILAGEKTKKHVQLGDPNMRAAMALAINPVRPLLEQALWLASPCGPVPCFVTAQ